MTLPPSCNDFFFCQLAGMVRLSPHFSAVALSVIALVLRPSSISELRQTVVQLSVRAVAHLMSLRTRAQEGFAHQPMNGTRLTYAATDVDSPIPVTGNPPGKYATAHPLTGVPSLWVPDDGNPPTSASNSAQIAYFVLSFRANHGPPLLCH